MKKLTVFFLLVLPLLFSCTNTVKAGFLSSLMSQLDALNNNMGKVGDNIGANYEENGFAGAFSGAMNDLGNANAANEEYRLATIKEFKTSLKNIVCFIPRMLKKAWEKFVDFLGKIRDFFLCDSGDDPAPAPATDPDPAPATDPDPAPATDPDPTPATDPDPIPATDPDPAPATDPDPTPATDPDPAPATEADETTSETEVAESNETTSDSEASENESTEADESNESPKSSGTLNEFTKNFAKSTNMEKKLQFYGAQSTATNDMINHIAVAEVDEDGRNELTEKLMTISDENTEIEQVILNDIHSNLNSDSTDELDKFISTMKSFSDSERKSLKSITDEVSRLLNERLFSQPDNKQLSERLKELHSL